MSARPITDTLRHIGGGVFIDTASDQLSELVNAVDSTGKKGSLSITITVKKASRGGAMNVTAVSKLAKPKEDPFEALLFATPEGNLVAEDPNQQRLDLRTVSTTTGEVLKNVGGA
jgi:hypothetical protein